MQDLAYSPREEVLYSASDPMVEPHAVHCDGRDDITGMRWTPFSGPKWGVAKVEPAELNRRCCTARSKSLTSLMPVAESPGAVRIGHPERGHLVEYLAPNSVFNSLPRQRSCSHLRPDDRFVTIDRVLHHASLGEA